MDDEKFEIRKNEIYIGPRREKPMPTHQEQVDDICYDLTERFIKGMFLVMSWVLHFPIHIYVWLRGRKDA